MKILVTLDFCYSQSQDKANRQKTPRPEQNLPRRNLLDFEKPEPEKPKKPEPEKTKKPEQEKKKPSKQPDFKLTPEAMKAIAARKGQIPKYSLLKNELRTIQNNCLHLQIWPINLDGFSFRFLIQ